VSSFALPQGLAIYSPGETGERGPGRFPATRFGPAPAAGRAPRSGPRAPLAGLPSTRPAVALASPLARPPPLPIRSTLHPRLLFASRRRRHSQCFARIALPAGHSPGADRWTLSRTAAETTVSGLPDSGGPPTPPRFCVPPLSPFAAPQYLPTATWRIIYRFPLASPLGKPPASHRVGLINGRRERLKQGKRFRRQARLPSG